VYLGPWEVVNIDGDRCVRWQCSYQGEVLEHYCKQHRPPFPSPAAPTSLLRRLGRASQADAEPVPTNIPADIFPHTLHARNRPYGDPCEMELYLTFREPHRIRYVTADGSIVHDERIEVKYEFTSTEGSHHFQSDLRHQDLVDHFDVDVIWSDRDGRTDSFGSVRGIGTIQRLKLWRDRYTTYHHLTFFANRTDRRYREYPVFAFENEPRHLDGVHRRLRLNAQGRRGSAADTDGGGGGGGGSGSGSGSGRRFSISSLRHSRTSGSHSSRASRSSHSRSGNGSSSTSASTSASGSAWASAASSSSSASPGSGLDTRYLGIQFSRNEGS